jgi:hypothetical protein
MCVLCPDYVASCWICTQPMRGNPDKTTPKQFYLEYNDRGKFCQHFTNRYHTDSPAMYDHISRDHSEDDIEGEEYWSYTCVDNCAKEGWYSEEQLKYVVDAFNKWGEQY